MSFLVLQVNLRPRLPRLLFDWWRRQRMAEAVEVVVPPSLSPLPATLVVGVLGMVCGLLLIFGPGQVVITVAAGLAGLGILGFVGAVVRRRPRVVITPRGFTIYKLFGEESHQWQDVDARFAVIKIGLNKAVGYHFTADYRARTGKKPTSLFSGYDGAISGAFALSAEELAELLNAHRRTEAATAVARAEGIAKLAEPDAPAEGGA
jgi:hypothetical protein